MNTIQEQDIRKFTELFPFSEQLANSTFLITGATGLIGSTIIHCLLALDKDIKIIAPLRNKEKAKELFSEIELQYIDLIECNLTKFDYRQIVDANYIIHCAAPTASKFFIEHPVETFDFIYTVSHTLLKHASSCSIKSFVYLSSLEVYGEIHDDSIYVTEDTQGYLDIMSVRSCYPMAKRAVENLCILYANQYQVPVKIARLTQTTGTGIAKNDNRVIAQFTRLAAQKKDIILHSDGNTARPYCYITDAVSAILYILLKGNNGEAYNIANENTYISVREMANFLRNYFAPSIKVKFELNENLGYAPLTKLRLSANKLRCLGWKPHFQLYDIFARLIAYYQCELKKHESLINNE